jgi:DNA-binding IclR family transcriptional regulator
MRLHRARGYGALKAVLGILAEDEPLTLTEVAGRLQRTPGSTRDYLGWLEDVDLVAAQRKRYAFADPLLRLWVRLNTGCAGAAAARVLDEVQRYAVARLSAAPVTAR